MRKSTSKSSTKRPTSKRGTAKRARKNPSKKKAFGEVVSINMAATIDGKIAGKERGFVKLGSDYDSKRMSEIRAEHDAIVMGARTFQAYPKPLLVRGKELLEKRMREGLSPQPATVVVSGRLSLPRSAAFEDATEYRRIVFCSSSASPVVKARLERAGVQVIQWPGRRPAPRFILDRLRALGFPRVLLEGGGELNATFFEAGLVDRIFLTLCPSVLGGRESPTIFEGRGLPMPRRQIFALDELKRVGDELYLEYRRRAL